MASVKDYIQTYVTEARNKDFNNQAIANEYQAKIFAASRDESGVAKVEIAIANKDAIKNAVNGLRTDDRLKVINAYGAQEKLFTDINVDFIYNPMSAATATLDDSDAAAKFSDSLSEVGQRVGNASQFFAAQQKVIPTVQQDPAGFLAGYGIGSGVDPNAVRAVDQELLFRAIFKPTESNKSALERALMEQTEGIKREKKKLEDLASFDDSEE